MRDDGFNTTKSDHEARTSWLFRGAKAQRAAIINAHRGCDSIQSPLATRRTATACAMVQFTTVYQPQRALAQPHAWVVRQINAIC